MILVEAGDFHCRTLHTCSRSFPIGIQQLTTGYVCLECCAFCFLATCRKLSNVPASLSVHSFSRFRAVILELNISCHVFFWYCSLGSAFHLALKTIKRDIPFSWPFVTLFYLWLCTCQLFCMVYSFPYFWPPVVHMVLLATLFEVWWKVKEPMWQVNIPAETWGLGVVWASHFCHLSF